MKTTTTKPSSIEAPVAHAELNGATKGWFTRFSQVTSCWAGSPPAFFLALMVIIVWVVTGPVFGFSDTWQLVINTGTTIVTFLMVFLIQSSQNRDSKLIQLKLDELIRAIDTAETALINMDEMSERELQEVQDKFSKVAAEAREELEVVREEKQTQKLNGRAGVAGSA